MTSLAITVKDIWRSVLPDSTELLAGGAGLERRVEWACLLRTRPPAFDAVKGGEIAFVPVRSLRLLDERLDLSQVMTSFAEKGGVAVAIIGDASAHSIDIADRLMMPLLRLPSSLHINDVHQASVRFILDQRTLLHERAQELQHTLMQLALSGAGPVAIVDRLAELTSFAAAWIDERSAVRHAAGAPLDDLSRELLPHLPALLRWGETVALSAADPPVHELTARAPQLGIASPIPSRSGVAGFIALIAHGPSLDQVARLAVSRAASACAIELDRERAVTETRERLEGEFTESLLHGTYASDESARERARRLGVELGPAVAVVVVRGGVGAGPAWEQAALAVTRNGIHRRQSNALVNTHQGAVCAVLMLQADAADSSVSRLVESVRSECARVTGDAATSAGIGRMGLGPAAVRASYREAEQALALGRKVLGSGMTASFANLGLHRLLFALAQHPELTDFYEDTVGPLLAYDSRGSGDLMKTLNAFFECHGSPTETAHMLHLHRNTVLYRLRRIEEVGGIDLDDAATRLNLHLCLRIGDVLQLGGDRKRRSEMRVAG